MTLFEVSTYALGVTAIAGVVDFFKKIFGAGDDGPIRVKGGSVTIESDKLPWVADEGDEPGNDAPEYTFAGQRNGWRVSFFHPSSKQNITADVRRVHIEIRDPQTKVVFRANGSARVFDRDRAFTASGTKLTHASSGAWIRRVKLDPASGGPYDFEQADKPTIQLDLITRPSIGR